MSTNEDKREFIEHPDSRHCPSIIEMCVLLEDLPDLVELEADTTRVKNLNDFKKVLIDEFDVLKNIILYFCTITKLLNQIKVSKLWPTKQQLKTRLLFATRSRLQTVSEVYSLGFVFLLQASTY